MPLQYRKMFVMWPPRPKTAIHPDDLGLYRGWWAQRKFNGTRNLIFLGPGGEIHFRTRHREEHRAYQMTEDMLANLRELHSKLDEFDAGKWHVFDSELLHNKTSGVKDRVVVFDVLVHNGVYLTGTTFAQRTALLYQILRPEHSETDTGEALALEVSPTVWLAHIFKPTTAEDMRKLFDEKIHLDEIEGLVLKDPDGRLGPGVSESNNGDWQIRVRKPHKNYAY